MIKEIPITPHLDIHQVLGKLSIDETKLKEIAEITYKTQTSITLCPTIVLKDGEPEIISLQFAYDSKKHKPAWICFDCGNSRGLSDEDAGSDVEVSGLCRTCFRKASND